MLKDISSPDESDELFLAAVKQWNETFRGYDWNVYLINAAKSPVEHVIVLSHGSDDKDKTSSMRHKIEVLPAQSFAKIELLQPELLKLNNDFEVSFFNDNRLGKMHWRFPQHSVADKHLADIPLIPEKGILADKREQSI